MPHLQATVEVRKGGGLDNLAQPLLGFDRQPLLVTFRNDLGHDVHPQQMHRHDGNNVQLRFRNRRVAGRDRQGFGPGALLLVVYGNDEGTEHRLTSFLTVPFYQQRPPHSNDRTRARRVARVRRSGKDLAFMRRPRTATRPAARPENPR